MESAVILLALALTTAVTYFLSYIKTWWAKTFTVAAGLVVFTTGATFILTTPHNILTVWAYVLAAVAFLAYVNMFRFKPQPYTG